MRLWVKLEQVVANPYQGRERLDREHIVELADDIQRHRRTLPDTLGLLQVPAGRLVDGEGNAVEIPPGASAEEVMIPLDEGWHQVQLAYGHHRLAAFEELRNREPGIWERIPVDVGTVGIVDLATMAWSENVQRRDLSVYDRARLLQRLLDDFQWSQAELARRLGLTQPAVSNALRLLRLPEPIVASLQDGEVSERQALAVLPLVELPAEVIENLPSWRRADYERMTADPAAFSSDRIREVTHQVLEQGTEDLEKGAPPGWACEAEGTRANTCEVCERNRRGRCYDPVCFRIRRYNHQVAVLTAAGERLGRPWVDPEESSVTTQEYFRTSDIGHARLQQALGENCENLAIAWLHPWQEAITVEGEPNVKWICNHEGRGCKCAGRGLSKAEAAEKLRQKQAARAELGQLKTAARAAVEEGLQAGELWAWRIVARDAVPHHQRQGIELWDLDRCIKAVVRQAVDRAQYWSADEVAGNRRRWDELVREYGGEAAAQLPVAVVALEKFNRIRTWVHKADKVIHTVEALRGNLDNLNRLCTTIEEADEMDPEEAGELLGTIGRLAQRVEDLAAIAETWDGSGFFRVPWLVNTPSEDINFKSNLEKAEPEAIAWALALCEGRPGDKTRCIALRRRLRKLEREEGNGG